MIRGRKSNKERIAGLITHPSQAPIETRRILVKPLPKMPKLIDLATRDERTVNYLERAKKRRI